MRATELIEETGPLSGADPESLYQSLKKGNAKLLGPDGASRPLPDSLRGFLVELQAGLEHGKPVQICQNVAQFSTAKAANMIGVSRQFLVNLLEAGEIPFHNVGTHRRIYAQDLLEYKARRDSRRKKVLRDLVAAEVEENLYENVPPQAH